MTGVGSYETYGYQMVVDGTRESFYDTEARVEPSVSYCLAEHSAFGAGLLSPRLIRPSFLS